MAHTVAADDQAKWPLTRSVTNSNGSPGGLAVWSTDAASRAASHAAPRTNAANRSAPAPTTASASGLWRRAAGDRSSVRAERLFVSCKSSSAFVMTDSNGMPDVPPPSPGTSPGPGAGPPCWTRGPRTEAKPSR